jgi:oxaloacetate decarboxylase alpha subunit
LLHVLEARRYGTVIDEFRALVQGAYGRTPEPIDPSVERAVELLAPRAALADEPPTTDEVRERAEGLAASEEELVLLAMFGTEAEELLRRIRARHSREAALIAEDADAEREGRIRELVKIVQESGVGEIEIEDEGMRVSVRRADEPLLGAPAAAAPSDAEPGTVATEAPPADGLVRVESPMVGVFYRAPSPGAPTFVDVGDTIVPGQTLCLLEAMKLFNELKAEVAGTVSAIHVENAEPVEFGQVLFEIEPLLTPPAV